MKILLLNTSDARGGAAVAAMRLMETLQESGAEVRMLVLNRDTINPDIMALHGGRCGKTADRYRFLAERFHIYMHNGRDRSRLFHVSTALTGYDVSRHPWVRWADVIHLHWINQGFLSLRGLERFARCGKPVVWTMHDMWPVTAVCHHARECLRYQTECGACPQISSQKEKDLARLVWNRKSRVMSLLRPTLIGCSHWLADLARQSALTHGLRIESIPNPINTNLFAPGSRSEARRIMDLPTDRILLLFGAVQADDPRKGIYELSQAMKRLRERQPDLSKRIALVVFGSLRDEVRSLFPNYKLISIGYIREPSRMAELYRAADLFVIPSLEENLPNTIMEALSVGTPCVAFRVGGIPEMIVSGSTGYLAAFRDPSDLAEGITKTIALQETSPEAVASACRSFVLSHYSREVVSSRMLQLYRELL